MVRFMSVSWAVVSAMTVVLGPQKLVARIYATPQPVIDRVKKFLGN